MDWKLIETFDENNPPLDWYLGYEKPGLVYPLIFRDGEHLIYNGEIRMSPTMWATRPASPTPPEVKP